MKTKTEYGVSFSFTDHKGNIIDVVPIIKYQQSLAGGTESWYEADRAYRTTDLKLPIAHLNHQHFQSPFDQRYYSINLKL